MKPLISIITINYNNAKGLERTIQSIVQQTFSDFEYIVIDGGSTDASVDVIKKYANEISYWVSEPDKGIYNAMNKGVAKAQGEYLLFINSGDELENNKSLEKVSSHLDGKDIVYFDLILQLPTSRQAKTYPDEITFRYMLYETLPHPASFIKKELFTQTGLYDERMKICSDWKFFILALCKHNVSYKHISETFSVFYLDGISSQQSNQELIEKEKQSVLQEYFSNNTIYINARFLTQTPTGVQIYAREICRYLKDDFKTKFVLLAPQNTVLPDELKHLEYITIGKTKGYLWEQIELPAYLKKQGFPLLINFCNTAPLLYKNQIVTIHDLAFMHHPEWFSKNFACVYRYLIPRIVKRAKQVITVSETIKKQLQDFFKIDVHKIAVIRNGLQADMLKSNPNGTKEKIVFTVSSINPRKNLQTLIKAFEIANLPDYKLIISGTRNAVFGKENFARANSQIEFTGYLSNEYLIEHYRKAEIFVSLSHDEGFGIPVLESAHFNCKLLLSDIPVYHELFNDVAHFVNQKNVNDCANALVKLTQTSIQQDYKVMLDRYSYEKSAEELKNLAIKF